MEKDDITHEENKEDISEVKDKKEEAQNSVNANSKEQIKSDNQILTKVFIGIGAFVLLVVLFMVLINAINHFEYRGINFNVVKDTGGLIFYNTAFPMYSSGKHVADYNVYLRTDPRALESVPFDGEIKFSPIPKLVYNSTGEFNCNGDGVIAVANFAQIFGALGIQVIKDENATCDSQGRYMLLNIQPGNETNIKQVGPTCYELYVNNCEILDITEKFIVESLSKINEIKEN
ncbi:MAG: hypothetical protein ACFFG0_12850 [Candidatus Thorarchaeota archaeon]